MTLIQNRADRIILTKAYKVNKPKHNFSYIQVVAFHLNSGFTRKIMEKSQCCFWHFSHKGNKLNEKLEGKKKNKTAKVECKNTVNPKQDFN